MKQYMKLMEELKRSAENSGRLVSTTGVKTSAEK